MATDVNYIRVEGKADTMGSRIGFPEAGKQVRRWFLSLLSLDPKC